MKYKSPGEIFPTPEFHTGRSFEIPAMVYISLVLCQIFNKYIC